MCLLIPGSIRWYVQLTQVHVFQELTANGCGANLQDDQRAYVPAAVQQPHGHAAHRGC